MRRRAPADFELIADWREHLRGRGLAETTIRMYTSAVCRLMTEQVESAVETTTEAHVDAFLAGLGNKGPTKAQSVLGLRSFFGWCHRKGLIGADPMVEVRVQQPTYRPAVALEEDELLRYMLAAAWRDPRRAWALMLTFSIGCRRIELSGIAPGDVFGDRVLLRKTKGGRGRTVELNELARVAIQELRPWWTERSILGGVVPQTITEWCHDAAVDSGLVDKVRQRPAHVLRASFATHLLRRGTPIHVVKDLMGHRDISTTATYLALVGEDRRQAVDRLPFASVAT